MHSKVRIMILGWREYITEFNEHVCSTWFLGHISEGYSQCIYLEL